MFLIIPLILVLASIVGIAIIVRPKLPYLRKLTPEAHQVNEHLAEDYFPELVHWVKHIPWQEYRKNTLQEIEKLLRKFRLMLLKMDHVSDRLVKHVRRSHIAAQIERTAQQQAAAEEPVQKPLESAQDELKAREQQLIIAISQDPKNSGLYETLGDLYVKMGNESDAKEAYEAALGFNPRDKELARKYSSLLKKSAVA